MKNEILLLHVADATFTTYDKLSLIHKVFNLGKLYILHDTTN